MDYKLITFFLRITNLYSINLWESFFQKEFIEKNALSY